MSRRGKRMPLSAKAEHPDRSNEGRVYPKYQVQNFIGPTG